MSFDNPEQDDAEDLPDWLQNLQTGSLGGPAGGADDDAAQSSEPDQDVPDWLDAPVADSPPPAEEAEDEEDVPDWLESIRVAEGNTGELPAETVAEPEPAEGETPDWLSNIREKEGNTGELPADDLLAASFSEDSDAEDVNPDWMESIREQEESSAEPLEPAEEIEADSGNFMDRIQELKTEDGLAQDDDQEEDWLSGLGDADTGSLFIESEETSEPDTMDWLGAEEPAPAESPAMADFRPDDLAASEENPAWLGDIEDSDSSPDLKGDAQADSKPDWLPVDGEEEPTSAASLFSTDKPETFDAEITDAFIASAESVDDVFPDLPGGPGEGTGAIPAWLDKVETGSLNPMAVSDLEEDEQQAELRSAAFAFSPDEEFSLDDDDLPSWLSDIQPEEPQVESAEPGEDLRIPTEPLSTAPAFAATEEDSGEFSFELDAQDVGESADLGDAERAELPSWLQAMRPVGAVTPAETGEQLAVRGEEETIGPLAGLRGVLPAEPAIVQFGDEVTEQSSRLHILDRERHQAKMLHQMVLMEANARPAARQSSLVVSKLIKTLTGLAMYLIVFLTMLFNLELSSLPDVYANNPSAAQVRNTYDLLETRLPPGPVLVVFEYEPAYTGEMNAAAGPMILQLALQNRPLVLISSIPVGGTLATEYMAMTRENAHGLADGLTYTNLGLITGGASGVLDFAYNPRAAAPKIYGDAARTSYWTIPPLDEIYSIRDFAAVIVLADDAEDAQVWVEQVEPLLRDEANPAGSIPLIVVSSAQAETMLYPYTQTIPAQIDGLVSGMKGGAYYEARMGRNHIIYRYWDGYGIGLTIGVVIITLSSVGGMASGLLRKREEKDV